MVAWMREKDGKHMLREGKKIGRGAETDSRGIAKEKWKDGKGARQKDEHTHIRWCW